MHVRCTSQQLLHSGDQSKENGFYYRYSILTLIKQFELMLFHFKAYVRSQTLLSTLLFYSSLFSGLFFEVPFNRGGFPPFYVPSEDMHLWPSACGAAVLQRSERGGSLGRGSQCAWLRRR